MNTVTGLNPDFRDVLLALVAEGAEFVIVSAYALALHGVPRYTGHLDILVRPTDANADRVWRALSRFGAPLEAAGVSPADFTVPGTVYQIGLPPRRIDLLTEITAVTFDEAWATRESARVDDAVVGFIGRDAFIRNKNATGRPKDLADAARLQR
jgi:hypothetical protein